MILKPTGLIGFGSKRAAGGYGSPSTAWSASPGLTTSAYENYSIRVRTTTLSAGGDQVRVRFATGSSSFDVDNCSVGIANGSTEDTTATPVELLFSAASGFTMSSSSTLTSDWVNLTTTTSDALVVIMDVSSTNGNPLYDTSGDGTAYSASASNTYATATTSMSANGLGVMGFNLIEVRSAL